MAYFAALGTQINMTYVLHDIFILGKDRIDRRGSEFYGFILKIFTRQFCLQKCRKNIKNSQRVMALWRGVASL